MSEIQYNINQIQQALDLTVGTPSIGDAIVVSQTSPLQFDLQPGGGGGTVDSISPTNPLKVDTTSPYSPSNPNISILEAADSQAGIVSDGTNPQQFSGKKEFLDIPQCSVTPGNPEDLTNKQYVDTFAAGLQPKAAVATATSAPGTMSSSFAAGQIINGYTLALGDRILIKNQGVVSPDYTDAAVDNGIYIVTAGTPTRATDYDQLGEAGVGTFTTVTYGSLANTQWVQTVTGSVTPGTTPIAFSRLNIGTGVSVFSGGTTGFNPSTFTSGVVTLSGILNLTNGGTGANSSAGAATNIVTGGASTIASADLTNNRALISNVSGKVAVSAVTNTELGYVSGVTSSIQNQLNGKQATITGGASTIASANLTANKALVSDGSGKVVVSTVTNTELGYVSGVTSSIQNQLNNKQPLDGDLTAIAALSTTGFAKRTATDTWALDTNVSTLYMSVPATETGTTYTYVLGDANNVFKRFSNAAAITVTVPLNSTTAFPIGTQLYGTQEGAGQVTVSPAGGVTILSANSMRKTRVQYSAFMLIKTATDSWYLIGDIAL